MLKQQFASRFRLAKVGAGAVVAGLAVSGAVAQTSSMIVTETGNVGIGLDAPARQLHLQGSNSVFRMDRNADTAAFLIVRTSPDFSSVSKAYAVGVNASSAGVGEFVINDLGTAAAGAGTRRFTISNTGTVTVQSLVQTSSIRYKSDVETLSGVGERLEKLRGVKFVRKETGREDVGLVAEEVAAVYPQLVERDAQTGQVEAVNYSAMVAVLIEGYKAQQKRLQAQEAELTAMRAQMAAIQRAVEAKDPLTLVVARP